MIEYNQNKGHLVKVEDFNDCDRSKAQGLRLNKEIDLLRKSINHEVVILEADSFEALLKTHSRYFKSCRQIGKAMCDAVANLTG